MLTQGSAFSRQTIKSIRLARGNFAGSTESASTSKQLQFFRIFQQLDYAFEQAPGAAAINAAMIEAQCNLCFGLWNKFFFSFVPRGDLFPDAEAEQQCLIGQGNRGAPFHSERSKI